MWRVAFILFVLFVHGAFAECVSVDKITKCARLPTGDVWTRANFSGWVYGADGQVWSLVYKGEVLVSGTASGGGFMADVNCMITYPFRGTYIATYEPVFSYASSVAQVCADELGVVGWDKFSVSSLDDDKCPDGFYTVPYDVSCGEGLVDVTGVPNCDTDMSGDFCLLLSVVPCAAGVTTLRTSTGVSVPLWAEKSTEPSLCVEYNNVVCYGNLATGRATDTINIEYNNQIYHLVD